MKIVIPPEKMAAAIQKCFLQTAIRIIQEEKETSKPEKDLNQKN